MWTKIYSVFLFEASLFLSISLSFTSIDFSKSISSYAPEEMRIVVVKDARFLSVEKDTTGVYYDLAKVIGYNSRKAVHISIVETPQEAESLLKKGLADGMLTEISETQNNETNEIITLIDRKVWLAKPESTHQNTYETSNPEEKKLSIDKDKVEETTYFSGTGLSEINTQAKAKDIVIVIPKKSRDLINNLKRVIETTHVKKELTKLSTFYFGKERWLDITPFKVPRPQEGQISKLDDDFKKIARLHGWDWRLIAAIAFKESTFNPRAIGPGNALGLMQFMPYIANHYKLTRDSSPEEQIEAALLLLDELYEGWSDIPDLDQRIKFTLASYNAGKGHIEDAQRVARSKGLNPLVWDGHVQTVVESLSDPSVYEREEVVNGKYSGPAHQYADLVYQIYLLWSV
ncbi:MAG: hypothetical protein RIQ90_818 [Bacteroidota bacterium]